MLSIVLALLAAFLFAVGLVLEQRAAMEERAEEALRVGFLLRLLRRPVWLLGLLASGRGYVAQAAALGAGRLVVVQPILVTSLVFALPLGASFTGQHVGHREIVGAIAVTVGVAGFLVISDPSGGRDDAPFRQWLIVGGVSAAAAVLAVLVGIGRRAGVKAALFGAASGILFGLVAALTKSTVDRLGGGIGATLGDWHLYALAAVSLVAFALLQASLQAGALAPSIATLMVFETFVGGAIGVMLFREHLHHSAPRLAGSLAMLATAMAGLTLLAGFRAGSARSGRITPVA